MTREQLKQFVVAARKQKFDPSPYKNVQKGLAAFRETGKSLLELVKKNPDA
jgi:hypothetical protein